MKAELDSNDFETTIKNVCDECGVLANRLTCEKKLGKDFDLMKFKRKSGMSTYHRGICDYCKKETYITETRDFFYPNFDLINHRE